MSRFIPGLLRFPVLTPWLVLLGLVGCAHAPPAELTRLQDLQADPTRAGALVYRGRVYGQGDAGRDPLFSYERRIRRQGSKALATHVTFEGSEAIVSQSARVDRDGDLLWFEELNRQTGTVGEAVRRGDSLEITVQQAGKRRVRRRRIEHPVVVGPSLFGYCARHFDSLSAGEVHRVQFATFEAPFTVTLTIALDHASPTTTAFEIRAASPLVRLALQPMKVVLDSESREVVRYEGRVPPKVRHRGTRLRPLDARVEYAHADTSNDARLDPG